MRLKKYLFVVFILIISSAFIFAEIKNNSLPVSTYSIIARDPVTGELGVAVQSHWFSVGSIVSWAEAGVGAIATQSFVKVSYGPEGLNLMRNGISAPEALSILLDKDENKEVRQVAMIDSKGQMATFTGTKCTPEAGHYSGDQFSVQANMMLNNTVWKAMAEAFQDSKGELVDRLIAALEAAEKEGGDIRGRQSAAILVVKGKKVENPWDSRIFDLRVEDHPQPVQELKRLVKIQRAYNHMNRGDEYLAENNIEQALKEYMTAEIMCPDNIEFIFWHAVTLVGINKIDEALPLFRKTFEADINWYKLAQRLPKVGLLPDDRELISKILEQYKK